MKFLFVAESMNINGANKSLINLLNVIDTQKHQVDLFLFAHVGPLMDGIPSTVNLLPEDDMLKFFVADLKTVLKTAPFKIKLLRLWAAVCRKILRTNYIKVKETIFKWVPLLDKGYDIAVGYCEGSTHSFILKNTIAKKKAGWIHIRFGSISLDRKYQLSLCQQEDYVVVVSEDSKQSALFYGIPEEKIVVIHNILPVGQILKSAQENVLPPKNDKRTKLLTVGRLVWQKGMDLLLDASVILKNRGIKFEWTIIGGGVQLQHYRQLSKELNVDDCVVFHGPTDNPYPYYTTADIYVQPSLFEGWGMAVTEAKILGIPVIASAIPVFSEQIIDGVNGLLSPLTPECFADSITRLINDHELYRSFVQYMSTEDLGYENEVNILYELCK